MFENLDQFEEFNKLLGKLPKTENPGPKRLLIPIFWVNKDVWSDKYKNTIRKSLYYGAPWIEVIVDFLDNDEYPSRCVFTSIAEFEQNIELIEKLLKNGKAAIQHIQ